MQGASADSAVCGYVVNPPVVDPPCCLNNMEDEECCVICLDSAKRIMFLPCGHLVRPIA